MLVSKELISLLHLSLLHLDEDKTTLSQEVSSTKIKAEPLVGLKFSQIREPDTVSASYLVVSARRNLGVLLF